MIYAPRHNACRDTLEYGRHDSNASFATGTSEEVVLAVI